MSAAKAELQSLLERIEEATGPSYAIETAITDILAPELSMRGIYPNVTASIDAALALVERTLPEWRWGLHCHNGLIRGYVVKSSPLRPMPVIADKPTAPLAILSALLRALIFQADEVAA